MTQDESTELAELLRKAEIPPDEAFVADVQWLIDLEVAFAEQRGAAIRRWVIDIGSVFALGTIAYVIADKAPNYAVAQSPIVSLPLLAAAAVAALWLSIRWPSLAS